MRPQRPLLLAIALLLSVLAPLRAESEAEKIISLLGLRAGMVLADVGAGEGDLAIDLAQRLGPATIVYATELRKELESLQRAVRGAKLQNVRVLEAGFDQTNLPPNCCDAILVRRVYHHFQKPALNNRSALQSLRPGGRLAIIDFEPKKHWKTPKGVKNRGGHGVARAAVIRELKASGFELVRVVEDWPEDMYAVLFRKPVASVIKPLRSDSRR
jgi:ubiquinone/menaquinone biosynthesis C-methylase UbiE